VTGPCRNVRLEQGPEVHVNADPHQRDHPCARNAVDAAMETRGKVVIGWKKFGGYVEVCVEDEGFGLPDTTNLFVPFFTTKPKGSGIGLVLSGGSLSLQTVASEKDAKLARDLTDYFARTNVTSNKPLAVQQAPGQQMFNITLINPGTFPISGISRSHGRADRHVSANDSPRNQKKSRWHKACICPGTNSFHRDD